MFIRITDKQQNNFEVSQTVLLLIYDAVHNATTSQQCNTNPYCMVCIVRMYSCAYRAFTTD